MKTNLSIFSRSIRKAATLLALSAFTISAFATLGDGRLNKEKPGKSLLSRKAAVPHGTFTLSSGYKFRGSQVISHNNATYINLNSIISYQTGNTKFLMPLKSKVSVNLSSQNQIRSATLNIQL